MTLAASETCRPHGDARLEPDTSGCRRDGAEHHGDPRRQEQARMALSDGIGIEAQLLGQPGGLHRLGEPVGGADETPSDWVRAVREYVEDLESHYSRPSTGG